MENISLFANRISSTEKNRRAEIQQQKEAWEADLASIRRQVRQVTLLFNLADDEQLIEAYIYELKALQTHENYLLGKLRSLVHENPGA